MNVSASMPGKFRTAATLAVLAAALALAACQTDGTWPLAAGTPKAEAVSVAAAAKPDQPVTQAAKPAEPAEEAEPMTRARAARECWMRTEKGNPHEDLDKRADAVNKCIEERLKAAGAAAPKS
ncbi:MAG TPA: hypothetical protein VFB29_06200 [Pseudolabrys sp.]|nr:hypothetical protein [Pseudolabrys sp.]